MEKITKPVDVKRKLVYNTTSIDRTIKQLDLLFSRGAEAPTDFELACKLIESIKVDWKNPNLKFLDPACGRGTFLLALLKKLEIAGHSRKHIITNMLYGVDNNRIQSLIAAKALREVSGVKPNITCEDSLTKTWNMKFDAVVGNPPYNESSKSANTIAGTSGNTTLYKKFIELAYRIRTDTGSVALVVQRNGIKHAIEKYSVSEFNLDTSEYWKFTAGYFVANSNDATARNITTDPIIRKTYSIKKQRPFRHAIGGSYPNIKATGKFTTTAVPGSVYGLVETPKENAPARHEYITGNVVPAGPKLVFKGLESRGSYTVTDLPAYVGSACVLFFDTIAQADQARLFILHNPIVEYLRKRLGEKAAGLVFRYIVDFDLSQIVTGTEIPVEFGLTTKELNLLTS